MQLAVWGVGVRQHFDILGVTTLLTCVDKYVEESVRVFYATVWIAPERNFIEFMF